MSPQKIRLHRPEALARVQQHRRRRAPRNQITDAEPDVDTGNGDAADADVVSEVGAECEAETAEDAPRTTLANTPVPHLRFATLVGLLVVVAIGTLTGWLGFRTYESHQAKAQRDLFLQVGRQGAINLTTIDYTRVDADTARILDSATGPFYDDFSKRSKPFVDVVRQAQSKSVGTVTAAGLESETDNDAQVLVAVTVKTSNAGAADQRPRAWRMRISVHNVGDQAKISNVEFVP